MLAICFYFQVHQPFRLRKYSFFEIGKNPYYKDEEQNFEIMQKITGKCYLPMNNLLLKLIDKFEGKFKVSFSISGTAIDQFEAYSPEVLKSFQDLVNTGCVEILSETYNHSLAYLFSQEEFKEQVGKHKNAIKSLFGKEPQVFRNTELIYNNDLGKSIADMGYKAMLAEGADHVLGWRSPHYLYHPKDSDKIKLLLKSYQLSDDIAFRFSNKGWNEYPLTVDKYVPWVEAIHGNGQVVNLFMDYETFGEHQWASTGIFDFMEALPGALLKHPDTFFMTPSEVADTFPAVSALDVPEYMSWADEERDLTAWLGNDLQDDAIAALYTLEDSVNKTNNPNLINTWRNLQTSDHFYYMCTKWFSDGDVHSYFNPYATPYDAYINYMNVLADFKFRVEEDLNKDNEKRSLA